MKYMEVSFNLLTATLFQSSFVRKNVFYTENIQYAYNFYGSDLYVNGYRGIFRTQSNIYGEVFLQKSQKSFTVDVRPGSKHASGIGFTVTIGFQNANIYLI